MTKTTLLALDPGNYQIKACDRAGYRAIRSVQYRLPKGINPLKTTPASPVIEIEGIRFHVGSQALKYRFYTVCPIASGKLATRREAPRSTCTQVSVGMRGA